MEIPTELKIMARIICRRVRRPHQQKTTLVMPNTKPATATPLPR
jgi:hypothetical protein